MITRTRTESRDSDMTGPASLPSHRPQTIAVFGLGPTGQAFCRAALDAGYSVRALVQPNESNVFTDEQPGLRLIEGELTSSSSVRRVIRRADYVVCLVGETLPKKAAYPSNVLTDFVHMLYPLMKQEDWIKAFLFQVSRSASRENAIPSSTHLLFACCYSRHPCPWTCTVALQSFLGSSRRPAFATSAF